MSAGLAAEEHPPVPERAGLWQRSPMMTRLLARVCGSVLILILLGGCGGRTKEDIVQKARNVSTRTELEKALGAPTDIAKLGPLERWTYKAANGEVIFVIVGVTVTLQATGDAPAKN